MKQRFSSLDVKVTARELNTTLTSLRISNIYDLSSRIFLLKCAKPGTKAQLLVDCGFRCHLTSFSRTAEPTPSAFVSKLRKYLKSRRITSVSQLGTDRVIEITFSDGQYRLFLEFFAAGNIVLTDAELNVLTLWRQVSEGDEDVDVKLGGKYVLDAKQNFHGVQPVTKERLIKALEQHIQRAKVAQNAGGKKARKSKGHDLKKAVSTGFSEYPAHLVDHVFTLSGFDSTKQPEDVLSSEELLSSLLEALEKAHAIFRSLDSSPTAQGFIIAKEKEGSTTAGTADAKSQTPDRKALLYDDFHPFRPAQFENVPKVHIIEIEGFNRTVDEFYSSIESQQHETRLTEKEEQARKKLEKAKDDHAKRLGALQEVQELHVRKAQTIEANTHRVDEAIAAVNGLIGQGMDWVDIGKLIENEQKRDNVVAQMIKLPLKLHENTVTLLLSEPGVIEDSDSDEEDRTDSEQESEDEEEAAKAKAKAAQNADKRLTIDIDLALSSWSNARQYYEQKRTASEKEQKTVLASQKALQSIEKKTEADLKKGLAQEKAALRPSRKPFFFEKFHYFVSSDGYLVLGGKDAPQSELLYRRYLKKGDIYVNADLAGASSVIVKNNPETPDAPIPPSTLSQAGALAVCSSSAWESKAVMAAWWVNSDQVSKTAPTGEYLKTGGFVIKGRKNFLPPTQLVLGFGVMFQITEESRKNHGKHRIQTTESSTEGDADALEAQARALSLNGTVADHTIEGEEQTGTAVPDVEDVGQAAELEVEDDEQAIDGSDEDDRASTVASETGRSRANPLQSNGKLEDGGSESEDSESDASDEETEDEQEKDEAEALTTADSKQASSSAPVKQQPQPKKSRRGANTRAKRAAKEKYALQTDEEREMAMSLLGSTKGQQKKEDEAAAKAAREAKAAADKERRRQQHERAAQAEARRQERLAKGEEEGNDEEEIDSEQLEQEKQELLNIDLLVPAPLPGDELVAAIPVVAPWTAMARTKYKVKLQPGSQKKGRIIKEILGGWAQLDKKGPKIVDDQNRDKDRIWVREIELIKSWKDTEVVGTVPVRGCKIVHSFSGGIGGGGSSGGGKGKGNPARGKGGKKR